MAKQPEYSALIIDKIKAWKKLVDRDGMTHPYKLFNEAETFEDLIALNIYFLSGKIERTFYHLSPIDPETIPLVEPLIKLHFYGVFTTQGQPSECEYGKQAPSGKYYSSEQKSYLEGYMMVNDLSKKVFKKLLDYPDLNVMIVDYTDFSLFTNIKKKENLTRNKASEKLELLDKEEWGLYSNFNPKNYEEKMIIEGLVDSKPNLLKIFKKTAHIFIFLKEYCKGNVEEILLKILADVYG